MALQGWRAGTNNHMQNGPRPPAPNVTEGVLIRKVTVAQGIVIQLELSAPELCRAVAFLLYRTLPLLDLEGVRPIGAVSHGERQWHIVEPSCEVAPQDVTLQAV
jgi:hypothetical protein